VTAAPEPPRLAAPHEYRLVDAPAGDELEAVRFDTSAPLGTPPGYALGTPGGRIRAGERPGGGATVSVSLPAA
jgi:hypothetical protein